jgi:manganese efflux pump family protein
MIALLLIAAAAVGLSNFGAAIGIGVSGVGGGTRIRVAVVFGIFEAGMPVLGLALGHDLASSLGRVAHWLGAVMLIAIGAGSLLYAWRRSRGAGSGSAAGRGREARQWRTGRVVVSGLALSVDNLAAGFAIGAYHVSLAVAAVTFGAVSVAMSLVGLELGARIGAAAGDRSELIAGAMLIAVGAAMAAGAL